MGAGWACWDGERRGQSSCTSVRAGAAGGGGRGWQIGAARAAIWYRSGGRGTDAACACDGIDGGE